MRDAGVSGPVDRERARFCRAMRGSAPGSIGRSACREAERMSCLRPLVRIPCFLLLKSGVVTDKEIIKILEYPETYIDSYRCHGNNATD